MLIKKRIDESLSNFSTIYGCYVNAKTIISTMAVPVLDLTDEETEMYSKLLKKSISGKIGKNIAKIDLDNPKDFDAVVSGIKEPLFDVIIESLDLDNYCIILVFDTYETEEEQTPYFICSICPIKDSKAELKYAPDIKEFRGFSSGSILSNPVIGISYPCFMGDIENKVSYYFAKDKHEELIEVLGSAPMSDTEVRDKVYNSIASSIGLDVIDTVAELSNLSTQPVITTQNISEALEKKDVETEKIIEIENSIGEIQCRPSAIIDDKISIEASGVKAILSPERFMKREIDGIWYLLVPIEEIEKINNIAIS